MTIKNKLKSIFRRAKWACEMVEDFKIDGEKAYKLATIKEQHIVAGKRFGKKYANDHDCAVSIHTIPFTSKDRKTLYVMSMATYEP